MESIDLEKNWRQCGLRAEDRWGEKNLLMLSEMFSSCLGRRDGGIAFRVRGLEKVPDRRDSVSILDVGEAGKCYETNLDGPGEGMFVGVLMRAVH